MPQSRDLIKCLKKLLLRVFCILYLRTEFYQIGLKPEDLVKRALNNRYGQFEFLFMQIKLCKFSVTFQILMNSIFHDCIDEFMAVYINDLLMFSEND